MLKKEQWQVEFENGLCSPMIFRKVAKNLGEIRTRYGVTAIKLAWAVNLPSSR